MQKDYRTKPTDIAIANISETRQVVVSHLLHKGGESTFKLNERAVCTELGTDIKSYKFFKGGFILRSIDSMYALRDALTDAIIAWEKQHGVFKEEPTQPEISSNIAGEIVIEDASPINEALTSVAELEPNARLAKPVIVHNMPEAFVEVIKLENLTNAQLRDMLDNQGVAYRKKATKAELIALLGQPTDIDELFDDEEWEDN